MSQHTGRRLTDWYAVNSLVLNIKKTKELIIDLRRKKEDHRPLVILYWFVLMKREPSTKVKLSLYWLI